MIHRFVLSIGLVFAGGVASWSQQGGSSTYDFLNLPNSARVAGLGGNQVGLADDDLNLWFHNPAALGSQSSGQLVLNYVPYLSDINVAFVGYAHEIEKVGNFAMGIHNISYGSFVMADEYAEIQGSFKAAEYALMLGFSRQLAPNIRGGITFKPILSQFESYKSFGLAADMGASYLSTNELFSAGIVLKNVGSQITNYNDTNEPLPLDLQLGVSQKLEHAPFRFMVTLQGLLEWDLAYQIDESQNGSAYDVADDDELGLGDNLLRHTVFGLEFVPSKTFFVTLGYNHRRRQELKLSEKPSTTGFSWGFGFKVYKFKFAYGSAKYHLAGSSNHFSLTANLGDFGL